MKKRARKSIVIKRKPPAPPEPPEFRWGLAMFLSLAGGWYGLHLFYLRLYRMALLRILLPLTALGAGAYAPDLAGLGPSRLGLYGIMAAAAAGAMEGISTVFSFGFLFRRREGWRIFFPGHTRRFHLLWWRYGLVDRVFRDYMRRNFGNRWWDDGSRSPVFPDGFNRGLVTALICIYLGVMAIAGIAGAGCGALLFGWFIAGNALAGVLWCRDVLELHSRAPDADYGV